jgi:hypothetical protein
MTVLLLLTDTNSQLLNISRKTCLLQVEIRGLPQVLTFSDNLTLRGFTVNQLGTDSV